MIVVIIVIIVIIHLKIIIKIIIYFNNIFINYNNYNFKIEEKNDENFLNKKRKTI